MDISSSCVYFDSNLSTVNNNEIPINTGGSAELNTTVLARAVFDNEAEVAQELSFSRGDILTVLKQDPAGFEGWWICSRSGKVGIAPGNRLEILGSVKPKNRPSASKTMPSPTTSSIKSKVPVQVNLPEIDPYDELPAMIEVPPPIPPHPKRLEQSIYANFGEEPKTQNVSKTSQGCIASLPTISVKAEEGRNTSAGLGPNASVLSTSTVVDTISTPLDPLGTDGDNQDLKPSDSIPKRSVKRFGLRPAAPTNKLSVRFLDPTPSENELDLRSPDLACSNTSTASVAENDLPSDSLHLLETWSDCQDELQESAKPQKLPNSTENLDYVPLSNHLMVPLTSRPTRSSSTPSLSKLSRPSASISSWQQTHSRIELLINEARTSIERLEKGGFTPALMQKMRDFENALSCELSHLERLFDTFNSTNSSLNDFIQEEKRKIAQERDFNIQQAFHTLKEPNPKNGFSLLTTSLEQILLSTQAIVDAVQLNWFDCNQNEQSKRGSQLEGSLSVSDREDSATTSFDSNDPNDFVGLLQVYTAQFNSHNLLVRGTAEEFIGCLQSRVNEQKTFRGYQLPTAGVLVATAKFLLRCSSQLVSLAANLSAALQGLPPSEMSNFAEDIEKLRSDLEKSGNLVCEALKGLIVQTKDVAGCLTSPSLDLSVAATTLASKPIVVLGPEVERLVGAIQDVVSTSESLRQTVADSFAIRNSVGSVER